MMKKFWIFRNFKPKHFLLIPLLQFIFSIPLLVFILHWYVISHFFNDTLAYVIAYVFDTEEDLLVTRESTHIKGLFGFEFKNVKIYKKIPNQTLIEEDKIIEFPSIYLKAGALLTKDMLYFSIKVHKTEEASFSIQIATSFLELLKPTKLKAGPVTPPPFLPGQWKLELDHFPLDPIKHIFFNEESPFEKGFISQLSAEVTGSGTYQDKRPYDAYSTMSSGDFTLDKVKIGEASFSSIPLKWELQSAIFKISEPIHIVSSSEDFSISGTLSLETKSDSARMAFIKQAQWSEKAVSYIPWLDVVVQSKKSTFFLPLFVKWFRCPEEVQQNFKLTGMYTKMVCE